MTQDELDALPEIDTGIGVRTCVIDGQKVMIPVHSRAGVLFQKPDDGAFLCLRTGVRFMVGWRDGARVKQRSLA